MRGTRFLYVGGVALSLIVAVGLWKPLKADRDDDDDRRVPRFRVDPFWPKPLPAPVGADGVAHRWVTGEVAGSCTDADDNVFTFNRGWQVGVTGPNGLQGAMSGAINGQDAFPFSAIPSPPVVAYDSEGNVVAAWGDPKLIPAPMANYGGAAVLPHGAHGCFVDYQGNVWVAGNGDGIVQKYSHNGTLLLQIGQKGLCDGTPTTPPAAVFPTCNEANSLNTSKTLLNEPPDIAVDPEVGPISGKPGDVYIADGYGNHRVVVFDDTGKFVTQFGTKCATAGFGKCPAGTFGATGGGHPHCVVLGNDHLVYACDRPDSRIEVFTKKGAFVREIPISNFPGATAAKRAAILLATNRACDIDFYPNIDNLASKSPTNQKYIVNVDLNNDNTWLLDHASGVAVGAFGRCGFAPCPGHNVGEFAYGHMTNVDSKGNVYISETITGRRIQKFKRVRDDDDKDKDDHQDDKD